MENFKFTAEELSELEALQIRGGASGNPADPMAQDGCINKNLGCGAGATQRQCVNEASGCGADVYLGSACGTQLKTCLGEYANC